MAEPHGAKEKAAAIAAMPQVSKEDAHLRGVAMAESQLGTIAQTLANRGGATLRGSITLGQDGRMHAVLIPTQRLTFSRAIPDALIHVVINPMANRDMMSVHTVEAVQRSLIETEQDAGFPIQEKSKVPLHTKRHSPVATPVADTRRESFGNGIIQADELGNHIMTTMQPTWNIQNLNVA